MVGWKFQGKLQLKMISQTIRHSSFQHRVIVVSKFLNWSCFLSTSVEQNHMVRTRE